MSAGTQRPPVVFKHRRFLTSLSWLSTKAPLLKCSCHAPLGTHPTAVFVYHHPSAQRFLYAIGHPTTVFVYHLPPAPRWVSYHRAPLSRRCLYTITHPLNGGFRTPSPPIVLSPWCLACTVIQQSRAPPPMVFIAHPLYCGFLALSRLPFSSTIDASPSYGVLALLPPYCGFPVEVAGPVANIVGAVSGLSECKALVSLFLILTRHRPRQVTQGDPMRMRRMGLVERIVSTNSTSNVHVVMPREFLLHARVYGSHKLVQ